MCAGGAGAGAFPDGAALTGLLVGGILSSFEPWYVAAAAASVGVAAKHLVRVGRANVFNPAALGSWSCFTASTRRRTGGARCRPSAPSAAWPLLLAAGLLVARRVNKLPLLLAFTATFFSLCTAATFVVDPADLAEVFVAPDLLAIVYFACFMLTDPPTSPVRLRPQVVGGALVVLVSVVVFIQMAAADYLLVGVLAGNVFEALLRHRVQTHAAA